MLALRVRVTMARCMSGHLIQHYTTVLRPRNSLIHVTAQQLKVLNPHASNQHTSLLFVRHISLTTRRHYELVPEQKEDNPDLKVDATDIFRTAISAVRPRPMIEKFLDYNEVTSTLTVQKKVYQLDRNVFVVGFGTAVLGMARVVEDMLGQHLVAGIISIPKNLQQEMREAQNHEVLLRPYSKIHVYEGAANNEADHAALQAANAIHGLVSRLKGSDLLIVLASGGGSPLFPSPHPPITLQDLKDVSHLLAQNGATHLEINTVRKNIEVLKGGGLAIAARPAKVLSLIMASVIDDPMDLIACGPTCPTQPTPEHCMEILNRLQIYDEIPKNVRRFLEIECRNHSLMRAQTVHEKATQDAMWNDVQNIMIGNNSVACDAAAARALELGYLPVILTKSLRGEARIIGPLYAILAKFIMMCFDRKASMEPNSELAILETSLVSGGIRKTWINHISNTVNMAHNMNRDICIIAGGATRVHVYGSGVGGKNMESVLAAAMQMNEEFRKNEMNVEETRMCFLSCDSDGHDGVTEMAGAVVDQEFLHKVAKSGLDMQHYLDDNDSFTFFKKVSKGRNLIRTKLTGTNVMDVLILLVQKPRAKKYSWNKE